MDMMLRLNLLHSHGSPTGYLYDRGCRCQACRRSDRDRSREKHRRYRENHRDEVAERNRKWAQSHAEHRAQYRRSYNATHREQNAAAHKCWQERNREHVRAEARNRSALIANAPGTHTAADVRAQYDRQDGICFYCGVKVGYSYHVDHVMPLSRGGSNGPENLVVACPTCNMNKHDKHPMEWCGRLC
jgi:5-methylcytosine-specific restriction endonuclease McrA